jgi:hypothetical protein
VGLVRVTVRETSSLSHMQNCQIFHVDTSRIAAAGKITPDESHSSSFELKNTDKLFLIK